MMNLDRSRPKRVEFHLEPAGIGNFELLPQAPVPLVDGIYAAVGRGRCRPLARAEA